MPETLTLPEKFLYSIADLWLVGKKEQAKSGFGV
jgi:hypothetical protein